MIAILHCVWQTKRTSWHRKIRSWQRKKSLHVDWQKVVALQQRKPKPRSAREEEGRQRTIAEEGRGLAEERRISAERQRHRAEKLLHTSQIGTAQREWETGDVAAAREYLELCQWDLHGGNTATSIRSSIGIS